MGHETKQATDAGAVAIQASIFVLLVLSSDLSVLGNACDYNNSKPLLRTMPCSLNNTICALLILIVQSLM